MLYLTPKSDFIARREDVTWLMEVTANPRFKRACESALLEMTLSLDLGDGRSILEVRGARKLIEELLNLHEPKKSKTLKTEDYLQST